MVVKIEVATSSAASTAGVVVASITVQVQHHIAGIVSCDGIKVGMAVIKKVVHGIDGLLVSTGGMCGKVKECMHHGWINSTGTAQEKATHLLDE